MLVFIEHFCKMCEKLKIFMLVQITEREDVKQHEVIFVRIFGLDFISTCPFLIENLNWTYPVDSLSIVECLSLRLIGISCSLSFWFF